MGADCNERASRSSGLIVAKRKSALPGGLTRRSVSPADELRDFSHVRRVASGRIADWGHAMGLDVVAHANSELKSVANSIGAEKRTYQLRIATVVTVLSRAELIQEKHIAADEAVALLPPGGTFGADAVRLLARLATHANNPATIADAGDQLARNLPD